MNSPVDTFREGAQYKGREGQWTWVLHRLSGMATVGFIITHVLDSTLITFFPRLYQKTIKLFKMPLAALGEIVVVGGVLFHGVNGLRVAIMDMCPDLWKHQRKANQLVRGVFTALYLPLAFKMLSSTLHHLTRGES